MEDPAVKDALRDEEGVLLGTQGEAAATLGVVKGGGGGISLEGVRRSDAGATGDIWASVAGDEVLRRGSDRLKDFLMVGWICCKR